MIIFVLKKVHDIYIRLMDQILKLLLRFFICYKNDGLVAT